LTSALRLFRGTVEPADDETVIVLERVALVGCSAHEAMEAERTPT